jgi:hypothetical protein
VLGLDKDDVGRRAVGFIQAAEAAVSQIPLAAEDKEHRRAGRGAGRLEDVDVLLKGRSIGQSMVEGLRKGHLADRILGLGSGPHSPEDGDDDDQE